MDRVAIIVDAEFFIKQFRQHADKNASPKEMANALHSLCIQHLYNKHQKHPDKLYRIMVYDCPPMSKKVHHPLTKRSIDLSKTPTAINRLAFHTELRKLRKVALRLGYLDERNASWSISAGLLKDILAKKKTIDDILDYEVTYTTTQKAVDMKIGLDISSLAYKRLVDKIILFAGDSDFVPAAKLARREGIDVVLDPMWKTVKEDLQEHIDGIKTTIKRNHHKRDKKVKEVTKG